MKRVILTIKDEEGTFSYDMEMSVEEKGNMLVSNIREILAALGNDWAANLPKAGLYLPRIGRFLKEEETMAMAGVWNGDYGIWKTWMN